MSSSGRSLRRLYNNWVNHAPAPLLRSDTIKSREYDHMTIEIARRTLTADSNWIDVGAHDGAILRQLLRLSAQGRHWAFEPIPDLASRLRRKFPQVTVVQAALSDYSGVAEFHYLPSAPGYSSLLTRSALERNQTVRTFDVPVERLDGCVPAGLPVAFVKIDVEGAEGSVLRGAQRILSEYQPVVVFECASADLEKCVEPLTSAGLRISLLPDFLAGVHSPLAEVMRLGRQRGEYYYVASPA